MVMKVCMVTMMLMVIAMRIGIATETKADHNRENHDVLCGILGAAVNKWKRVGHGPAKKALAQAIFGNTEGGNLEDLKRGIPSEYKDPGKRDNWCRSCTFNDHTYPGKSITHDLLCLCTLGSNDNAFPDIASTLCGRSRADLAGVSGNTKGWSFGSDGQEHLKKTWEKVITPCLQNAAGVTIEHALKNLTESLRNRDTLSWASSHSGNCGGQSYRETICVDYSSWCLQNKHSPQWWNDFASVLSTQDFKQAEPSSSVSVESKPNGDKPRYRRSRRNSVSPSQTMQHSEYDNPQNDATETNPISHLSKKEDGSMFTRTIWILNPAFLI
ncbi:Variant surface glycoprotein [Trypanosoma congolense IL3000]|uniref:Variant surface glycoprotein n=1 Tax=Trypanosoma congolense (strain IL3000) TaxID=1068625 RepID=F9WAI5_TRYCI|nr:Variant surface glycoprotein [Trypanosoma congolense IL3000]